MPVLNYRPFPSAEPDIRSGTPYQSGEGATAAAFGGGVGAALQNLGATLEKSSDTLMRIATEPTEFDKTAAREAAVNATLANTKRLYGDPDVPGDTGFYGKEGRSALDALPQSWKDTQGTFADARAGLQNDKQRRLFDQHTSAAVLSELQQMSRHAQGAFKKYQNDTYKADIDLKSTQLGQAALRQDEEGFNRILGEQYTQIDEYGAHNGWSPAQIEEAKSKVTETGVISKTHAFATRGDFQGALDYLDANRDHFRDLNKLEDLKREYTTKRDTGAAADAVDEAFGSPPRSRTGAGGKVTTYSGDAGDRIAATLKARGWSPAAIEGALNNAITESSLNPNATGGAGEKGLFQFHPGSHITPFTRAYGGDWSPEAQANYVADVVEQSMPDYGRIADPRQATATFLRGFEKPKDQSDTQLNARFANSAASRTIIERGGTGSSTAPAQPSATAGTDQPAPGSPAARAAPGGADTPIVGVGDSLAAHLVRRGGAQGKEDATKVGSYRPGDTAVSGWGPNDIRDKIIPKIPDDQVRGKSVALSTGASNRPDELDAIPAQIEALKKKGATNVVIMGVGPAEKLAGVNDKLAQIAKDNNVAFAGPQRAPNPNDPDKLHSRDQAAEMTAVRGALGSTPTTGTSTAPATPGATPDAAAPAAPTSRLPDIDKIITGINNNPNLSPKAREAAIGQATTRYNHMLAATHTEREELTKNVKEGIGELIAGRDWTPPSDEQMAKVLPPAQLGEVNKQIAEAQERKQFGTRPSDGPIPDLDARVAAIRADTKLSPAARDKAVEQAQRDQAEILQETHTRREQLQKDVKTGTASLIAGRDWTPPSDEQMAKVLSPAQLGETKQQIADAQAVRDTFAKVPGIPDRDQILADISANPNISEANRGHALAQAEQRYNQMLAQTSVERKEFTKSLDDGVAALAAGQQWTPPSDDAMHRLLPPAAVAEVKDKIGEAQEFGDARNKAWYASPEDINKQAAQLRQGLQDTTTPGFARRARYADRFDKIVTERNKALFDDPAAFAAGSPPVAAAYAAAGPNPTPEAMQTAIRANLAEQERLGVRRPEDQHVLTKEQAKTINSQIANMDPEKQDFGPILDGYATLYGPHWNKAFGDLVQTGMPTSAQVLGTMDQHDQASYRTDFERMIKTVVQKGGAEQLKQAAGPAGKDVDKAIDAKMQEFKDTTQGDVAFYNTYHNAVRDLAYYYAMQLNDGQAAVDKAYEGIIGRRYDFEHSYRAPKGTLGTVDAAAHEMLTDVTPQSVRDPGGGDTRLTEDFRKRQEYDAIMRGRWVNTPDGTGVIRMAVRENGSAVPARRGDGSVIQFNFSQAPEIAARGANRPPVGPLEIDPRTGLQ